MNNPMQIYKTIEVLNPPHIKTIDLVNSMTGIKKGEAVKVRIDSPYCPSPLSYIQALEKVFPETRFKYDLKKEHGAKWAIFYIDTKGAARITSNYSKPVRMCPSAKLVDPFNINLDDILITDIAHHLSRICRFNGGVNGFYSVAEHCIKVASLLPTELKAWGLMHDAAEAYLGDTIRPVKHKYKHFLEPDEKALLEAIALKFGLPKEIPAEVWKADDEALRLELEQIEQGRLFGSTYSVAQEMFLRSFKHFIK